MSIPPNLIPLPLESLNLAILPKITHNITWSPDDELAIGCDDCVLIYVPDFTLFALPSRTARQPFEGPRQYDEAALRFPVAPLKSPELNRHLFDAVGQEFSGFSYFTGSGSGPITGHGSTMNHTVSLAWSPCGLGRVGRSVLAVHTAAGIVTVYCQGAAETVGSGARSMRPWMSAWHVGGGFLVPVAEGHTAPERKEYISAFSWSRDTCGMGAFMAYLNDEREIVVLWMKATHDANAPAGHPGTWTVLEVARFMADGPHPTPADPTDPDYVYHSSSFALSWSPWLRRGDSITSIISYVSHNYIGFRQITVEDADGEGELPYIDISPVDASGVCLYLSTDAFVVWEDRVWTTPDSHVCRGVIASPTRAHAFELPLDGTSSLEKHSTDTCDTTYPAQDDVAHIHNPITGSSLVPSFILSLVLLSLFLTNIGLTVHPPSISQDLSTTPSYTLVRLSATHDNPAWHQTNVVLPVHNENHIDDHLRWVTEISQIIQHQLPRALAYSQNPRGQGHGEAEFLSDDEELGSELESDDDGEFDSEDDARGTIFGIRGVDTEDQVHLNRVRIWGMTTSPGGGTSAVFISQHSTLELGRDTFAGLKCRVLFGRNVCDGEASMSAPLSTEAKAWEWMYGGGPPVPGLGAPAPQVDDSRAALRDRFEPVARRLACVFCDSRLLPLGTSSSRCGNGHVFENCANTGVPIVAPNISRTCGVCGMKCLKLEELLKLAPQLKETIEEHISADLCGGCGGKFTY
ncbi:hypothetical protein F4861DRAFT_421288 [Xylaria intraflava]|nr:hypothetical protein F4861DRAFT_421288 [Xylaria intraflava]